MDSGRITQETLNLIKGAKGQDLATLEKAQAYNQAFGLVWYDLEPAAKLLYPVITPLRNMIPRVGANGGTATNWKAITGININKLTAGVSEGNRTGKTTDQAQNFNASYKGLGYESDVSFEADYAAMNFDDVKALAVLNLLRSLMIAEEQVILVGDGTFKLNGGNAATAPVVATSNTTGNLTANSVYDFAYVPLTPMGYFMANANGITQTTVRTTVSGDNETINCGTGVVSANNSANSSNKTSMTLTATAVKGAAGYAWYASNNANGLLANATFIGITTIPTTTFYGNETRGSQKYSDLSANDASNDSLVYDGLWAQIVGANSNAYFKDLGGNNLSVTNGTASIVEVDTALKSFWDNFRLGPTHMLLAAQEVVNINNKIISGNGAPLFRFNMDAGEQLNTVTAGAVVGQYLNKFSVTGGSLIKMMLHPNMPPGSIMFYSDKVPYPLSNVTNILQLKMRREYYQIEWPLIKRAYQYGVYCDGVLQNYFPPAFGMITGINNG